MTKFTTLPPSTEEPDKKECILASKLFVNSNTFIGEIYEHAVFQSIEEGDIKGFERNYSTLNFYYNELK